MRPVLVILVIIVGFWSGITTIKAIYLILTKPFDGSKSTWILTVMIAIIGPILWITKGKKLLKTVLQDIE